MMRRPLLIIAGCVAAAGSGVAGATALTAAPNDVKPQSLTPAPGTDSIDATAPDPAGGPDWAVRAYRNETGGLCLEANRYDGRTFGRLDEGGLVALPLDPEGSGSCADLTQEPLTVMLRAAPERSPLPARSVLYGAVAPSVTGVTVTTPDGTTSPAETGPRGTFVVPVDGYHVAGEFSVDATLADGTTVHRQL